MKKIAMMAMTALLLTTAACGNSEPKNQNNTTQTTPEEKSKFKLKIDGENNEVGVETDKVDIELKGEDKKKE